MPPFTSGKLKIQAAMNLGLLGPPESQPIEFEWKWQWGISPVFPWALLALLLFIRPNRNLKAWAILLSLTASLALVWATSWFIHSGSDVGAEGVVPYGTFSVAFTTLCLTATWLPKRHRDRANLAVFAVVFLASAFSALWIRGLPVFGRDSGEVWIYTVLQSAGFVVALALARHVCRKRFTPRRFLLWLAVFFLGMGWIAGVAYLFIYLYCFPNLSYLTYLPLPWRLFYISAKMFPDSFLVYIAILPLLALVHWSSFFRERFAFPGPGPPPEPALFP